MPLKIILPCLSLLASFVVWWGFYSSNLIIKAPRSNQETNPEFFGLSYEDISFISSDGVKLKGWFIPVQNSQRTVVVCHGWSAERSNVLPSTAFLHKAGYNLLYFDFRNHGESGGILSSIGPWEIQDLQAALDFLKGKKVAAEWVGVWGLSMGAAVALTSAAQNSTIKAVVAESAFSSYNEAIVRFAKLFYHIPRYPLTPLTLLFVRWRLGLDPEEFSPRYFVDRISPRPILFIQGGQDLRMPASEGMILYRLAKEPKELWTVPQADHGEAYSKDPAAYEHKVLDFFKKA